MSKFTEHLEVKSNKKKLSFLKKIYLDCLDHENLMKLIKEEISPILKFKILKHDSGNDNIKYESVWSDDSKLIGKVITTLFDKANKQGLLAYIRAIEIK